MLGGVCKTGIYDDCHAVSHFRRNRRTVIHGIGWKWPIMSSDSEEFKVGDPILIVGTNYDGELGTVIAIAAGPDGQRYLVVFENGNRGAFSAENLSHRR
jgi:hypothetical protein